MNSQATQTALNAIRALDAATVTEAQLRAAVAPLVPTPAQLAETQWGDPAELEGYTSAWRCVSSALVPLVNALADLAQRDPAQAERVEALLTAINGLEG